MIVYVILDNKSQFTAIIAVSLFTESIQITSYNWKPHTLCVIIKLNA